MKKTPLALLLPMLLLFSGCELVGDIFQGGFAVGVVVTIVVIVAVLYFILRLFGRRR